MSEHRFCENRFRSNEQEIEKLKKTNAALLEAAKGLLDLIEKGVFVRDISQDNDPGWTLSAIKLVQGLKKTQDAIAQAEGKP